MVEVEGDVKRLKLLVLVELVEEVLDQIIILLEQRELQTQVVVVVEAVILRVTAMAAMVVQAL